jgi:hypothetical protein
MRTRISSISIRQWGLVALALLPIVAIPLLGTWVLAISVLLLTLLLLGPAPGWSGRLALASGVAGGLIGVASAGVAMQAVSSDPVYAGRVGFGWAALLLAVVAAVGGLLAIRRPRAGGTLMLVSGLTGSVSISLFFINTVYLLALPLWLIGAVLAFQSAGRQSPATTPPPTVQ